MKKYQVIYADPPWKYAASDNLAKKSLINSKKSFHYSSMELEELKNLDVKKIIDNKSCILFLWTGSPVLRDALEIMKSWGFEYSTIAFVWNKIIPNPGYYTLSQCEICLIGKIGKIPLPRGSRKERQYIKSEKERHSKKPNEVRDRISKMFPTQNKIELFSRQKTEGWDIWGNELENSIKL